MLIEDIKKIKSRKSELRKFGLTVGIVLGLLGGLFLLREKDFYYYFLILSAVLLFLGLVVPAPLKPIHKAWMTLAVILGWFMTRVILSILFYLLFTPIRILASIFNKDFLDRNFNENSDSYWVSTKNAKAEKSSYEKQF